MSIINIQTKKTIIKLLGIPIFAKEEIVDGLTRNTAFDVVVKPDYYCAEFGELKRKGDKNDKNKS